MSKLDMDHNLFNSLIGGTIVNVDRVCNLITINICTADKKELHLHIQSFFRIIEKDKIILSSEDIYRCGTKTKMDDFEWDVPGQSVFDESMTEINKIIINSVITKVQKEKSGDLIIYADNDICLQAIIDTTEKEEKYRLFNSKEDIIVES